MADIPVKIKVDSAGVKTELNNITQQINTKTNEIAKNTKNIFNLQQFQMALPYLDRIRQKILEIYDKANVIESKSGMLGMDAEKYQALADAGNKTETSIEKITDAVKKLNQKLAEAKSGSEKIQEAFAQLGIVWLDTNNASAIDRLIELSDNLNSSQQVTLQSILGENFQEIIPALKLIKSAGGLDAYNASTSTLSNKDVKDLADAGRNIKEASSKFENAMSVLYLWVLKISELGFNQDFKRKENFKSIGESIVYFFNGKKSGPVLNSNFKSYQDRKVNDLNGQEDIDYLVEKFKKNLNSQLDKMDNVINDYLDTTLLSKTDKKNINYDKNVLLYKSINTFVDEMNAEIKKARMEDSSTTFGELNETLKKLMESYTSRILKDMVNIIPAYEKTSKSISDASDKLQSIELSSKTDEIMKGWDDYLEKEKKNFNRREKIQEEIGKLYDKQTDLTKEKTKLNMDALGLNSPSYKNFDEIAKIGGIIGTGKASQTDQYYTELLKYQQQTIELEKELNDITKQIRDNGAELNSIL